MQAEVAELLVVPVNVHEEEVSLSGSAVMVDCLSSPTWLVSLLLIDR